MQTETTVRSSDSSAIGAITDLGPLGVPFLQTNGTEFPSSLRFYSTNELRTSTFNGRPVSESPFFDARECLLRSTVGSTSPKDSLPKETANIAAKAPVSPTRIDEKEDYSPLKSFEQNFKHKIETNKKAVGHERHRIGASFLERNPSHKVPRFVPTELEIGEEVGEGNYGTVYEIDSLTRDSALSIESDMIPTDSERIESTRSIGAGANLPMTLPVLTDLTIGSANLNNFLKRRVESATALAEMVEMKENDSPKSVMGQEFANDEEISMSFQELHACRSYKISLILWKRGRTRKRTLC